MPVPLGESKDHDKSYKKRQATIEKKATELATLCDVPVCVIIKNVDGSVSTVPPDRGQVLDLLSTYKRKQQEANAKAKAVLKKHETWDSSFNDSLPEQEKLMGFIKELEEKLKMVDEAIRRQKEVISTKGKGRRIIHGGDRSGKINNKKLKGTVLIDSKATNSSSSGSGGGGSSSSTTTTITKFCDGVSTPRKLIKGNITAISKIDIAPTAPPVKLFGVFLN